jgi:hypothetical protein
MWQWYHLRAQELARERIAEADAWRLAHAASPSRGSKAQQRREPLRTLLRLPAAGR